MDMFTKSLIANYGVNNLDNMLGLGWSTLSLIDLKKSCNDENVDLPKFKVVDIKEGRDTLGYCYNMNQVWKLANERIDDTDGECLIEVSKLDVETYKYKLFKIL